MSVSKREPYFWSLPVDDLSGVSVILDVDNTVLASGEEEVREEAKHKVKQLLEKGNAVYLCSNFKDHHRNERVAHDLGIPYIRSSYLKPSSKVIESLPLHQPIVVIGDKFLTDGLFAKNIQAEYRKVRSVLSKSEPVYGLISVIIDSIVGRAIYTLYAAYLSRKTR